MGTPYIINVPKFLSIRSEANSEIKSRYNYDIVKIQSDGILLYLKLKWLCMAAFKSVKFIRDSSEEGREDS